MTALNNEVSTPITESVWFKPEVMSIDTEDTEYQGNGSFGVGPNILHQAKRFYGQLAKQMCSEQSSKFQYRPEDGDSYALQVLAVHYHLASADNESLSPRQFWDGIASSIFTGSPDSSVSFDKLADRFFELCDEIDFLDVTEAHTMFCRKLYAR